MINWMQFRIRSKWLNAHLQLVILLALHWQPMTKWELLDEIYSRSSLMPEETEFNRIIQLLLDGGFVQLLSDEPQSRMSVNARGLELLSELEGLQLKYFESAEAPR